MRAPVMAGENGWRWLFFRTDDSLNNQQRGSGVAGANASAGLSCQVLAVFAGSTEPIDATVLITTTREMLRLCLMRRILCMTGSYSYFRTGLVSGCSEFRIYTFSPDSSPSGATLAYRADEYRPDGA